MTSETERLLRAANAKLNELHKRAQDYTTSGAADPVRIAVYHYSYAGGADVVAAIEEEMRAILAEQQRGRGPANGS